MTSDINKLPEKTHVAYVAINNGIDRDIPKVVFAGRTRDQLIKKLPPQYRMANYTFDVVLFDPVKVRGEALARLNGIEKMVLGVDETPPFVPAED